MTNKTTKETGLKTVKTELTVQQNNNNLQEILSGGVKHLLQNDKIDDFSVVEKIINAQQKINDKQAEQTFYQNLSMMREEIGTIKAEVQGQCGAAKFKYAPLRDIMKHIAKPMSKYGFVLFNSDGENGQTKTVLAHSAGHSISKEFGVDGVINILPKGNPLQQKAAYQTYVVRYNVIALLGLTFSDDDDEGLFHKNEQASQEQIIAQKKAQVTADRYKEQVLKAKSDAFIEAIKKSVKTGEGINATFGANNDTLDVVFRKMYAQKQDGKNHWDEAISYYEKAIINDDGAENDGADDKGIEF